MLLGEILVRSGKVKPEQVQAALRKQKEQSPSQKLGSILAEEGWVSENDVLAALAEQFGVELRLSIQEELFDPSLLSKLPVDWARSNVVLPVRIAGGIGVLTCDPTRVSILDDLALLLRKEVVPVLAPKAEILKAIERCYYRKTDSAKDLIRDMADGEAPRPEPVSRTDDLLQVADQAPVTQLINLILLEALKMKASDVHLEPFERQLRIRYRVDGLLYDQSSPPKHLESALVSRLKVMARLDIAEKRLPQDGAARVRVGEQEIDIRVSTIPVAEGERVVLRLLSRESTLLPLAKLGMSEHVLSRFRSVLKEPNGVVLVTGPTGSGKTTTLYAALQEIDTRHLNVLTIEDPIEYQLPHIGQMQVKPKIGLTFAQGLRHILRQDPDVILVGETRDLETAEILVRASLTGHLVFSTLHTNDAPGAVVRLVDMGIPSYLLGSALKAVMAQRLIRRLCPQCREQSKPAPETTEALKKWGCDLADRPVWNAKGCPACLGGYRGRTGIYELMQVDAETQEFIREGAGIQPLRESAHRRGMRTLFEDGLEKAQTGETSISEVLRAVGMQGSIAAS